MEKELLGAAATGIAIIGYILYARSVLRGRSMPHVFSWLIWGLISGIAFAVQVAERAGPGAWSTAVGAVGCLLVFTLGLRRGSRSFSKFDWTCLTLSLLAVGLWIATDIPLTAAILVTIADAIAYVPTYRKGFRLPFEEHLAPYLIGAIIPLLAIPAIERYVVANWLSPASLIITNAAFVTMVLVRRQATITQTAR
ncbi:MAG: hypothetical protein HY420_01125 [Candidatus Kerfeldbacteria bacterium]|nr:hypothetical protein [Candidatus Kerfeldbacteria bacterium]